MFYQRHCFETIDNANIMQILNIFLKSKFSVYPYSLNQRLASFVFNALNLKPLH